MILINDLGWAYEGHHWYLRIYRKGLHDWIPYYLGSPGFEIGLGPVAIGRLA